ncbi:hypothetical protein [Cerasicoccus frondis]|uniref:hypothetical protein n=1 Tax=Cerasicoccus frondis TaxID=490090 RepID=UPI00285262D3|nr:hypothetical protein [Cerasicoccus frondis]
MTHGFSTDFCKTIRWIGKLLALCAVFLFVMGKGGIDGEEYKDFFFPAMMLYFIGLSVFSIRSEAEKRALKDKQLRKYQQRVDRLGEACVRKHYRRAIQISLGCFLVALCIMFLESMFMVWPLGIAAVGFLIYASKFEKPATS